MSQLPAGAPAPDFELTGTSGQVHRLAGVLRTGPAVLVFYKEACPTCQFAFPFIQKIFTQVGKTAAWTLWGISQDEPDETRGFAERFGITFDLLVDPHPYPVSSDYSLQYVPAIFIVGTNGRIELSDYGFTKASLNSIAGFEFFRPNDGLPASRPG